MAEHSTRIGDTERERVRDLLQRHAADGRLTLDELSDRLAEVYAARTAADLDRTLRELPPLPQPQPQRRREVFPGLLIVALLLSVWAITAATTGFWFFWPLWPLLFIALLARGGAAGGGCSRPGTGRGAA